MALNFPNSQSLERLPWFVRFLLGCLLSAGAVELTAAVAPLRAFPLLLAFPTVILAAWFLGIWGAAGCALTDVVLVNAFLTRSQLQFSMGNASQEVRMAMFVLVSVLVGWSVRRLSEQKSEMTKQELEGKLRLAEAERQLAEERAAASEQLRYRDDALQVALQASGMGLWVWDLEKDVVHRSDQMHRMVGCEPGALQPTFEEWFRFVHPEDVAALKEAFSRAREDGTDYHITYRVLWPDRSQHWLESQGKCQRDAMGSVVRVVGVMADVTKRRQADEALLRAEKLAIAGRLAASVAHEINNPLEAMANLLYLVTMSDTVEGAREKAAEALEELMRVSLVAQSTLKFHRESGAPRVTMLSEVLESVLAMFAGRLRNQEIRVVMEAREERPIACMASEIQQIFANLIVNAIESMQRKGKLRIRIHASLDWRDRARKGMRVTVCDTGVGIRRALLRKVFEPFFTTKAETGTGLGLWVVAQLVERHGGSVRVWSSSREGASGTSFSVFLPFVDTQDGQPGIHRQDNLLRQGA